MGDERFLEEESILWTAFRHFDLDRSGEIEKAELHKVLLMEDVENIVDHDCIDRIMKDTDFNGDGRIDFEEFICMMRHQVWVPRRFDKKDSVPTEPQGPLTHPR